MFISILKKANRHTRAHTHTKKKGGGCELQSGANYTMPMIYSETVAWVLHKTGNIKLFNKGSKK